MAEPIDNRATKTTFIRHLHAFRGFAILTIVGAHSWSFLLNIGEFANMPRQNAVFSLVETLFHGSTIYFALISGLLFSLVLRKKGWKSFFRSKALHVLTPYALISLFFLSVFWPFYVEWFESEGMSTNFLVAYFDGLLNGRIQVQFWYIPILLLLYAVTPILDLSVRSGNLLWIAVVLVLLPLVVSRTTAPDFLSISTLVYFAGAYTLGMLSGMHYDRIKTNIKQYLVSLWIVVLACSAVVLLLFLNEYEASGPISLIQSIVYVQKLCIAAVVLHYFSRYEYSLPQPLFVLGSYAFAIYFLHFFAVTLAAHAVAAMTEDYVGVASALVGGLVVLVSATALSLVISWLLKRLFRRRSRMIIGA